MRRISAKALLCFLLYCGTAAAYPALDWKVYDNDARGSVCFYESNSIYRTGAGLVRVWIKCLGHTDLATAYAQRSKAFYGHAIVDMATSRHTYGYQPPVLAAETLDRKEIAETIEDEAIADLAGLAPNAMAYDELDCKGHRLRTRDGGPDDHKIPPSPWKTIPSRSGVARLAKLVCP